MSIFATLGPPERRYSYLAVLLLAGLGGAFPAVAGVLLGVPLAVGMVGLGIAHGACDQLVVPASPALAAAGRGWGYWARFLGAYLGLAAVVLALWWQWPAATVALFFLLTVWHGGSADAPTRPLVTARWWLLHSLLRGLLVFAVPAWCWPTATAAVVNGLLGFAGAAAVAPAQYAGATFALSVVVVVGHLGLWLALALGRRWALLATELAEVAVLTGLFAALPPQLSVGVYFVFWHSLQHVLRLNGWLGYRASPGAGSGAGATSALAQLWPQLLFFLRRAAPLLLLSCVALLVLGRVLAARLPDAAAWFSLALVVASVVTLPHALLVTLVMDAPQWRRK